GRPDLRDARRLAQPRGRGGRHQPRRHGHAGLRLAHPPRAGDARREGADPARRQRPDHGRARDHQRHAGHGPRRPSGQPRRLPDPRLAQHAGRAGADVHFRPGGGAMTPTAMLVLATAAFLATHFVSSTPLRPAIVAAIGEWPYVGLYSAVAAATLGWMVWAYVGAPREPLFQGSREIS